MSDPLRVGFIGLGDQGAPMAAAIAAKFDLHVWARRAVSFEALGNARHVREKDPVELAANVDLLCLCLRGDSDLHDLLTDRSLLQALGKGATIVNHATGDPAETETFERITEELGVHFLDAPVSGGRPGAEARSLTCFVGGRAEALDASRPVIECHSTHIFSMGPVGSGQMAKLCNNALTVSNLRNIVEVFAMAEKLGVSLEGLRDAFEHSSGGSFILQALGTKVTAGNAAHIAELNRTDVDEFAAAMRRKGVDPTAVLEWAIKGPDGLEALVQRLQ
ncbi:3-hydroxyisobutyrate dehydrogenase-like beta-hydroxyacid dehydrogenase [Pararhizobium capsulatum DSM 1112]|uniref:3-hydroxyisobutyrate dehydrogenase-like beta-hydroxyacid dehydrogenase n=1 Tax=Pararhizobium capsulatum DSM 1112 TaxID=1121113 RepID=A0ABU0BRH7_9HYPH|nr:NAD(P)-dependent oxidoreductase [Pararhizobium capsulatum]MDQ0320848.1 3-hydroxyisobutyrate dehydrogenase-like beta-hydroxyacid dehydrogenase [Pararhizobium capsulatum DSM 1112]